MRPFIFALRSFRRKPGFAVTVLVTLALAVGANTAIFSVVNALFLKSLPYAHPEQLGTIYARTTGLSEADQESVLDGEKWELLRDNTPSLLSAISAGSTSGVNLQSGPQVQFLHAGRVSEHFFDVLSIRPSFGRFFSADEDRPHGPSAVVLSYAIWKSTFAADTSVVGRQILLKGQSYTVVGVLPQDVTTPLAADVYTPLQPSREGEGQGANFYPIVRLRDGATWEQANVEINRAWATRARRYAQQNRNASIVYHAFPLQQAQTKELRPQVLTLMLSSSVILLIACANLAGLSLVRIARRSPEFATRLALGASRVQLQKQLWLESLVLAVSGALVGVGVGFIALRGLLLMLPKHFLPVPAVRLDLRVLVFTLCVGLLASVFFGALPGFSTRHIDIRSAMSSRAVTGNSRPRLRQGLIAAEVAVTVVLLAAAGLLLRTLIHLETLPPGFNAQGVMTAKASLDDARYHDPAAFQQLMQRSVLAIKQIPGVTEAAVGLTLPYELSLNDGVSFQDGPSAGQQVESDEQYVTPEYFKTLEIPMLSGRNFSEEDRADTQRVAIVNRAFAQKFFGKTDPVGRYINKDCMIIGVVADTVTRPGLELGEPPLASEETVYVPATQVKEKMLTLVHTWFQPSWIVRTSAPNPKLTEQMQQALTSVDPNVPFSGFYSMNDLLASALAMQRIEVTLLGTLAGLALLLSAIGISSLVASTVVERTRELGIRIALGSTLPGAMLRVSASGVWAALGGLIVGIVLCAGLLRTMKSVLYGVKAYDPSTLVLVVVALAAVTLLATGIPTLRIARLDPTESLRSE